ncbi:MAG: hypothetical protein ACKOET_02770 [Verrucomicrobiota bacterium]
MQSVPFRRRPFLRMAGFVVLASAGSVAAAAADEASPLYIEGYAGQVSYAPGEALTLHVSTTAEAFEVEVARLGGQREVVWAG